MNNGDRMRQVKHFCRVLLLLLIPTLPAFARINRGEAWAAEKFAAANRMREALNGRPVGERTRRDYQRVIDAYRRVYYASPTATKADPSVVATAELMVEMGRQFNDAKILESAIHQYQFLRREYPGSKYRFDALFTIGEIYKDDLDNSKRARSSFQEFLKRYPHHRLTEDARAAIAELDQAAAQEKASRESAAKEGATKSGKESSANKEPVERATESLTASGNQPRKMSRVTGIRHWSTPDYTRVAIDVEQEVKFDSQRIEHPDRIFFDLQDTRLASTLVGKSFDVEDGFLKKIRVAQFQPGRTRVVLEVADFSEYNAFLLPNPYRLIIDIRGKQLAMALAKPEGADGAAKPAPKQDLQAEQAETPIPTVPLKPDTNDSSRVEEQDRQDLSSTKVPPRAAIAKAITKKIVEADDEATDQPPASVRLASDAKSKKASLADAISRPALRLHGKIRAADGNDDEIATLDGNNLTPEPKSALVPLRIPAAQFKSADRSKRGAKQTRPELIVHEAQPTATGDRSLTRALGLKIGKIVIDPGHGGHDTGTIGPNGLEEKDLVLDVSKRLGKLLQARLGADVVYTRRDDTFIPLETRTAIANQEQADLFVSVHANSSRDADARGVETYYLNFTTNRTALEVAARENAVSDKSIHELQDLVKKIALKEKIEESREFASDVQRALHSGLALQQPGIRDRGVKKAPFIVLIGANMPSILAEISFVSNPKDEHKLESPEYRERIAESLYKGIAKYVSGLSGVKVASRMTKAEGQ